MVDATTYEPPPLTSDLCDAILKYHWNSAEDDRRSGRLYEKVVAISDRYLELNRELLEEQDLVFLSYSHDHTSVFVTLDRHENGLPMMKWVVCKPLGAGAALPKAMRDGNSNLSTTYVPSDSGGLAWGSELYAAVMSRFWFDGEDKERESLNHQAVLTSDRFWEANRDLLDVQEWVMLTKGINDLIVLVGLDDFSEEEKHLIWSPAKIEAWYGALPREIRKPEMPWVHKIAFNNLEH